MIVGLSRRNLVRRGKIYIKLLLLAVIVVYLLPKLISLLWEVNTGPKIRDDHMLEKPLRVISLSVNNT